MNKPVHAAPGSTAAGVILDIAVDGSRNNTVRDTDCLVTHLTNPWIVVDLRKQYRILDVVITDSLRVGKHQPDWDTEQV